MYLNGCAKVTYEVVEKIRTHVKKFELTGEICAWYKNMDEFYSDWAHEALGGLSQEKARERYNEGKETGEFQFIKDYGIIRYVLR